MRGGCVGCDRAVYKPGKFCTWYATRFAVCVRAPLVTNGLFTARKRYGILPESAAVGLYFEIYIYIYIYLVYIII